MSDRSLVILLNKAFVLSFPDLTVVKRPVIQEEEFDDENYIRREICLRFQSVLTNYMNEVGWALAWVEILRGKSGGCSSQSRLVPEE